MLLRLRKVNVASLPAWIQEDDETHLKGLEEGGWGSHSWGSQSWTTLGSQQLNQPPVPSILIPFLADSLPESFPGATLPVEEREEREEEEVKPLRKRVRFEG